MEIFIWILSGIVLLFGFVVFFGAPYVPSQPKHLRQAFDQVYRLRPRDVLLDLGSGDGAILREVSRRGARAVGFELNPALVLITRWLSRGDKNVSVRLANLMRQPFPDDTTIVYLFANSRDIRRIIARIQRETNRLERDIFVLSYAFTVPNLPVVKKNALHTLYVVRPLQMKKPQV